MFQALGDEQLNVLADVLNHRLLNRPAAAGDDAWHDMIVKLVEKEPNSKNLSQL